ncbi:hypothetical protein [Cupriavidus sp. DL-D2]|uniref:hypothetical protein n=1 Tax=Cupriavidus sp. DL-D2 TaxID=3144974 RepID=UPI003215E546
MNNQEAFTLALTKLRQQEFASVSPDGTCLYRSQYGCCAVGHMLPAELEVGPYNGQCADSLLRHLPGTGIEKVNRSLLARMQRAHDMLFPMPPSIQETEAMTASREGEFGSGRGRGEWEGAMKQIAEEFDLNYEVPA